MRRRFALVFNSTAGVAIPRLLDGVLATLRARGADVFQLAARNAAEAAERVADAARAGRCEAVIAAGGDGTFRAAATGAAEVGLPVGLVPLGTGNVLAHEIGLPRRAHAVAEILLSGSEIEVTGGVINGAPFFLMVGAGFDARVVSRLNYRTKRALGRTAYTYPVLKTLAEGPRFFDVDLDGRAFEASWLILTFASRYGGSFVLTRETSIGGDRLIAVVIEARSRFALAAHALALGRGTLGDPSACPPGVHVVPIKAARIGRQVSVPLEVDGDDAAMSPAEVSADGPRVRLIVPDHYVAELTNRHANRLS
ncbi:diacylglycerol/lipid kinase family protein [Hyphomicrobium sp.]|jgi:diacylglycerol kinase family enzyme|uniref:diacylglycerol/lipid kinase family protein n=1 Tax=Hyphomicrobium sp. TaxID=82 RepID=UPI002BBC1B9B|nr:diacylglycerol kinase family protein [Hyphomicrobium sp.]HVZ04124.1 diacylglycerol kinase family protein [Hyphomicrobium sp.]